MNKLNKIWVILQNWWNKPETNRVERYLNEATDIYDLEFRQRQIDRADSSWTKRNA